MDLFVAHRAGSIFGFRATAVVRFRLLIEANLCPFEQFAVFQESSFDSFSVHGHFADISSVPGAFSGIR